MYEIVVFDYIAAALWLAIFGIGSYIYTNVRKQSQPFYSYYSYGLWAKMLGGFAFALIYAYYYNYQGDTFVYYRDVQHVSSFLLSEPLNVFKVLIQPVNTFDPDTYHITSNLNFFRGEDTFVVIRIVTLINFIGFNTYLGTTIVLSYVSFLGIWKLFLLFRSYYPSIERELAIAILFFPSVIFWGSGLLKDSIVIGGVGFILFNLNELIVRGKLSIFKWAFLLLVIYITALAKAYVVISLLPACALWVIPSIQKNINNRAIKVFISPVLFFSGLALSIYLFTFFGESFDRFSLEQVIETAQTYQDWHYYDGEFERSGRGSSYTLGDYDANLVGVLSMIPSGITVTLFRPYLWEIRNSVMAIAALESTFVIFLTLYALWKVRIGPIFNQLRKDSFLTMCLIFSLIFAFAVGFSSYNFGALVRYKIPCIPMYLSVLFVMINSAKINKGRFSFSG